MQRFNHQLKDAQKLKLMNLSYLGNEKVPFKGAFFLCALLLFQCLGCRSVGYFHQAAMGQWQIERSKKPIQELKQAPNTSNELKAKFETIQEIRRFAFWNLSLPAEDAYDSYVALDRDYVVWNVTACPEFSMDPYRWWYPFLGKLKYRGYFDPEEAHQYAQNLKNKGYDVAVEGVVAYSTLGWFRDPVFDTFLDWSDVAIAELLFHELSHRKVFLSGKTDWNEAFAVVTARASVRAWLKSQSLDEELKAYEAEVDLEETFIGLILETKQALETLYASFDSDSKENPNSPEYKRRETEKITLKQSVFDGFRKRFEQAKQENPSLQVYDGWMSRPLNNARLSAVDTYYQWVPMFEDLHKKYANDWKGFFEAVKALDEDASLKDS